MGTQKYIFQIQFESVRQLDADAGNRAGVPAGDQQDEEDHPAPQEEGGHPVHEARDDHPPFDHDLKLGEQRDFASADERLVGAPDHGAEPRAPPGEFQEEGKTLQPLQVHPQHQSLQKEDAVGRAVPIQAQIVPRKNEEVHRTGVETNQQIPPGKEGKKQAQEVRRSGLEVDPGLEDFGPRVDRLPIFEEIQQFAFREKHAEKRRHFRRVDQPVVFVPDSG